MRVILNKKVVRACYFIACCIFVVFLSGFRSGAVYGKLDFILLDSRPWWLQWQPMISSVLRQGDQPILTDKITGTVLRAVFDQKTVAFRYNRRFSQIDIEKLLAMNSEKREMLPMGALSLLLDDEPDSAFAGDEQLGARDTSILQIMLDAAMAEAEKGRAEGKKYPYRCLINLHGFTPSWVPTETGHWSPRWAEPSLMYEFKGKRGKDMEQLLRDDPPVNCTVYF